MADFIRFPATTFGGPVLAGTVPETNGTTAGKVQNVGFTAMVQGKEGISIADAGTVIDTGIVLPQYSEILEIKAKVTTAFTNSNTATLTVGATNDFSSLNATNMTAALSLPATTFGPYLMQQAGSDTFFSTGGFSAATSDYKLACTLTANSATQGTVFLFVTYMQAWYNLKN
jgi:Tfp pilus assembly major pilin PilA|tara:strand:- start:2 stop:517 length:516 start_codon:yes stop_codon:yes gene_type:complete